MGGFLSIIRGTLFGTEEEEPSLEWGSPRMLVATGALLSQHDFGFLRPYWTQEEEPFSSPIQEMTAYSLTTGARFKPSWIQAPESGIPTILLRTGKRLVFFRTEFPSSFLEPPIRTALRFREVFRLQPRFLSIPFELRLGEDVRLRQILGRIRSISYRQAVRHPLWEIPQP